MKSKRKRILLLIAIPLIFSILIFLYIKIGVELYSLPIPAKIFISKSYETVSSALVNKDYQQYSAMLFSIPKKGEWTGEYYNPETHIPLYLDTSYGGGYICCEQPTYYVFIDKQSKLFWIEDYQAGVDKILEHWYGPFRYLSDSEYSVLETFSSIGYALTNDNYRKYPTNYVSLPKKKTDNNYYHPTTEKRLEIIDRTQKEATSLNVFLERSKNLFWIRFGNIITDQDFWSWYGPFRSETANVVSPEQTKQADGSVKVVTRSPLALGLTVPTTATYTMHGNDDNTEDWGMNIMLDSGTYVWICTGCQVFIRECQGPNEENCTVTTTLLGKVPVTEYVLKNDPGKVIGYLDKRPGDPIIQITPANNTPLSQLDKDILIQILSTMQRYSQGETISLF